MGSITARKAVLMNQPHVESADGIVASFNTDMKAKLRELKIGFTPVQNLNGYNYPWPPGGEKNLIPYPFYSSDGQYGSTRKGTLTTNETGYISFSGNRLSSNIDIPLVYNLPLDAGTYTMSFTNASYTFVGVFFVIKNSSDVEIGRITNGNTSLTFTIEGEENINIDLITSNSITTKASGYLQLEFGSEATSYMPYSNVCPIYGSSGISAIMCGENMLKTNIGTSTTFPGGSIVFNEDGTITLHGTPTSSVSVYRFDTGLKLQKGLNYYLSGGSQNVRLCLGTATDSGSGAQYTPISDQNSLKPSLQISSDVDLEGLTISPMISTNANSEFEKFADSSFDVTWESEAGTVYCGYIDPISGVLTSTMVIIDMGKLNWNMETDDRLDVGYYFSAISTYPYIKSGTTNRLCSHYRMIKDYVGLTNIIPVYGSDIDKIMFAAGSGLVYVIDSRYTTGTDFKTAMSGVQLLYEITEPITYQLTPQCIKTLIGTNHIWSDDNTNIEVQYYKH